MAGYTRNDTSNNIATGNVINAADLDGEFDALVAAFHASTGHTHDGTAANGAPITKIGPAQDLVISTGAITPKTDNTVDLGSSSFEFKDLYIDGTANIDALVADTADINAGTIDGVTLGTNSAVTEAQIDNININGNTISSTDTNGNISLVPNGTGDVILTADTIQVGDSNTDVTVTTNGTGDLIFNTNAGTNSGVIRIYDGANGNIALTPNGTGEVDISKVDIDSGAIDGTAIGANSASTGAFTTLSASSTVTLSGGTANGVLYLNGSKAATSGSALTFDGVNLSTNTGGTNASLGINSTSSSIYLQSRPDISYSRLISSVYQLDLTTVANQPISFGVNNSEAMRLTSTGLGIGTSSPATLLDLRTSNGVSAILRLGSSSSVTNSTVGTIEFYDGDADDAGIKSSISNVITGNVGPGGAQGGNLLFSTATSGASPTERMRLDSSGNLGIGTSSPGYRLDTLLGAGAGNIFRAGQSGVSNGYTITTSGSALTHIWANGGSDAMRLDSSGNLGLGVTPSAWSGTAPVFEIGSSVGTAALFQNGVDDLWFVSNTYFNGSNWIYKKTGTATQYHTNAGKHEWFTAPSGTAGNAITFTQAMTLDASGTLLVGKTSPAWSTSGRGLIEVNGSSSFFYGATINGTQTAYFGGTSSVAEVATVTNIPLAFLTNNTERARITSGGDFRVRGAGTAGSTDAFQVSGSAPADAARIDSSGNLLVGTTSASVPIDSSTSEGFIYEPGAYLAVGRDDGIAAIFNRKTTDGDLVQFRSRGTAVGSVSVTSSATAYNTSSDYRLKDNPQPLTGSGAFIDALKPKTWNWKADGSRGVGFIAHEVQEVSPGSVVGEKDGEQMQAMEYGSAEFIANIIAELQSLRQRVALLEGN